MSYFNKFLTKSILIDTIINKVIKKTYILLLILFKKSFSFALIIKKVNSSNMTYIYIPVTLELGIYYIMLFQLKMTVL